MLFILSKNSDKIYERNRMAGEVLLNQCPRPCSSAVKGI